MSRQRKKWLIGGGLVSLFGLGIAVLTAAYLPLSASPEHPTTRDSRIMVKTIRPKLNPRFVRSIKEPAYVEAYAQAALLAHVAGTIKYIEKDIGDVVTKGEVLVKIDVPDLEGEVAQKEALIEHAAADLKGAEANVVTAEAAVRAAQHQIDLREAERTFRAA